MKPNPQPPQRLPVLTEVVLLPSGDAPGSAPGMAPVPHVSDTAFAATAPSPLSDWAPSGAYQPDPVMTPAPAPQIDEAALADRVLADLERQLDLMFEQRLREAMSPVLTRLTDTLVRELRHQLAGTMREMVTRAVSQEIDRVRRS